MNAALLALLLATGPARSQERLVDVAKRIPDAIVDLRYATPDNFTHEVLYHAKVCLLREGVAERLARAAGALRKEGYRLVLWDCYRPRSVQLVMWKAFPHRGFVADPRTGSNHNRGAAVDVSLATAAGEAVEMPTGFDSFDRAASPGAIEGVSVAARAHRKALRDAMEAAGFAQEKREWWHYNAPGPHDYPLLDVPLAARG